MDHQALTLPPDLEKQVRRTVEEWTAGGKVRRLWARDATLWTGADEADWLGWLGIVEDQPGRIAQLRRVAEDVKRERFTHALLLGMGGSSLCPELLKETFGRVDGFPELFVLDSTDPAQNRALERKVDLAKTLFIVASKSGSTLEPNIFKQYYYERVRQIVGAERAGSRFVAITDPGSRLRQAAEAARSRQVFFGVPSIGGRYSALSDFGMVPAAVMGLDVARLLGRAKEMADACGGNVPAEKNPGAVLGVVLGVLATLGRDKVTLVVSPAIYDLGAWLEQLLAESTGKEGKGLIPVDREPLGPPEVYGADRLFVYLRLASAPDEHQDSVVQALEGAGHPVVRITVDDLYDLGAEFFRWEFATAVAGSVLGVNALNQPDVEASQVATRRLTDEYEKTGKLPPESPLRVSDRTLAAALGAHFRTIKPGDYVALLAYVEMTAAHEATLQAIRRAVRDPYRGATCVGLRPRFPHSTGQAHNVGPDTGLFLRVTCDDAEDLPVPGRSYTFGAVKAAQARGDLLVLVERGRRALRVHLGADVADGLRTLRSAVDRAIG